MNNTGQHNREIKEAVQRLAGTFLGDNIRVVQARVNSVDTTAYTCHCTPISGNSTAPFPVVNLSANNNEGFIPIPAICSTVLVAESTKNNPPYLIGWDLLQGLICIIQNSDGSISQLLIQNGTIQLNDGSNGGLVISDNVLSNLNTIITYVNTVFTATASALDGIASGAGAGVSTAAANTPTFTNMQNEKITHGV